ncbi:hypothetical protein ACFQE1_11800, partial [Halobium palmae]
SASASSSARRVGVMVGVVDGASSPRLIAPTLLGVGDGSTARRPREDWSNVLFDRDIVDVIGI